MTIAGWPTITAPSHCSSPCIRAVSRVFPLVNRPLRQPRSQGPLSLAPHLSCFGGRVGEDPGNEVALQAGRDMKRLYPKAKKSTLQLKPQFDCTHVFTGKVLNSISQC